MSTPDAGHFFFCIGSQKTGTTLLAQLIDRHPDMCCTVESYPFAYESDVGMMNPDSERGDKHGYSRELREELFDTWHHSPLNVIRRVVRRLTGLNWTYPGTFRRTMSRALQDFADRNDARVVGDKWPFYIPHIKLLRRAFPEASLIYTVRDPRGLWNSAEMFKERSRGDEILGEMLRNDEFLFRHVPRESVLTVRFEDMVADTAETTRRICDHLGAEWDSGFLEYDPTADPYPRRWDWIPRSMSSIDPSVATKWRDRLEPAKVREIEARAATFMDRYGYVPEG